MKYIPTLYLALLALLSCTPSLARADDAGTYQVRPVVACRSIDHPPNVEEARLLVRCAFEQDDFNHGAVYREDVPDLQIGTARAYTYGDPGSTRVDPDAPVYPIRGSWTQYVCAPVSDYMGNAGRNCQAFVYTGTGICYRTPFADWKCETQGGKRMETRNNIAGPKG